LNRLGISGYTALSGNKLLLKSRYEQGRLVSNLPA
jgi:hypothetical protein